MNDTSLTEGGWRRSLKVGVTAAKVGGKLVHKKTHNMLFNNEEFVKSKDEEIGEIIFMALGQLKGLALKGAQVLGQEVEMLLEPIRKKLQQSFNQAPALNRALVRKMVKTQLDRPREEVFASFDEVASAAASIGQVHRATLLDGTPVAVKLQYPGVSTSVKGDLKILRMLMKQFVSAKHFESSFHELQDRLLEEVDYNHEAQNIMWHREHLPHLRVPKVYPEFSNDKMLVMEWIEGLSLNDWIATKPSQEARNKIAQDLWDMFTESSYQHLCLHSDPNPGNFIIQPNGELALIDFGSVKRFTPDFIYKLKKAFPQAINSEDRHTIHAFIEHGLVHGEFGDKMMAKYGDLLEGFSKHIRKPYTVEVFDFAANKDYIHTAFSYTSKLRQAFADLSYESDIIFMDRVRYGFMRIFTEMEAKVRIRNKHEQGLV